MAIGDKPLIAILMAVYEPRMDWLAEQLKSLNGQTYPNLQLYVRDDCSPSVSLEEIEARVKEHITAMPYTVVRNEKNLGSRVTFERLTEEAEGTYFAYCDQDDIWSPEKLEILERELAQTGAPLACSDVRIIDAGGAETARSITRVRRHHVFRSGPGLARELLVHNFVIGCTMLVEARRAKEAVPFCPYMVHDHYIALFCAAVGELRVVEGTPVAYRLHGGNQTGLLAGVHDKASYEQVRIGEMQRRLAWLKEHFPRPETLEPELDDALRWAEARSRNWRRQGGKREVWKYRRFSFTPSVFELVAPALPEWAFRACLACGKRNMV